MNRNELERMLTQVDEQYVGEILEAEEMTAEQIPVITKKPHFVRYAAMAAAVCVCVVGGCWMLSKQGSIQTVPDTPDSGVSVGQSADTSIEEHVDYDLIWETPENFACIDYTWDAGGKSVKVTNPTLPFAADAYSIREAHFNLDANGTPENMYLIVHGGGGDNTIRITLHEKGHLFPANFFVDLSADAGREKPAIHIYETTKSYGEENTKQSFELYFIWNGVGFSMECDGISLQEAEQIAASFLNQTCAGLFAENDPSRYFALEQPLVASADFTMESTGGTHELDESCAFFAASPFGPTHFSGRYYLREDGSTANIQLSYINQDKTQAVDVTISGTGTMYAHGQLDSAQGADRNGTMLYGSHMMNDAVVSFRTNGWECQITANDMTDDEVLLFCDEIIEILETDFAETAAIAPEEYFFRDISEITTHRLDYQWNGLQEVHIEDPGLDIPMMLTCPRIYATGDDMAQFALFEYGDENGSANIYLNAHGDMGSVFPITGPDDGRKFNGVMVYGFSDAKNAGRKELYFLTKEGLGCSMVCHKLTEKQVLDIAKEIMDEKMSLQLLLEKTALSAEDAHNTQKDYTIEWEIPKRVPTVPDRNAGGKYDVFGTGIAAFPADEVTGYIYRDANGTPVNILVRTTIGEKQVSYTLSDAEEFYLEYFDADVSDFADSDKPEIHIVETKDSTGMMVYEMCFWYTGTAVSMTACNCTQEEALAYAETLLYDKPTVASASALVSDREIIDREDYLLVWDFGESYYVQSAEPDSSSEITYDISTRIEAPQMPFEVGEYTDFTGILYHDTEDTPFAVYLEYKTEKGSIKVQINDAEHPSLSPSGSLGCKGLSEEYGEPVILGMKTFSSRYRFCYTLDGTSVVVNATGYTADEAEQMIAAIFREKMTAKDFGA